VRPATVLVLVPTALVPVLLVPLAGGATAADRGGERSAKVVRGLGVGAARGQVGDLAVRHRLPIVGGFSARMTEGQANALARIPGVRVDAVRRVSVTDTATDRDFGALLARQTFSVTGSGVGICVVDTGIDPAHEQVAPRGVTFHDFIGSSTTAYDNHGHGTHVASIAAGDGDSTTGGPSASAAAHIGVAPGAGLYAAKVLDAGGSGPDDGVMAGIQWCAGQPGVRVISMSLGDSVPSDGTDPMSAAVDAATAAGKVVVVAAGNAGDAPSTIPSPGAAATAVTVGAVSDWSAPPGADYRDAGIALAPFSSRGPILHPSGAYKKPDVAAPGVTVSAADAGTTGGYVAMSGTSMATPYVAGVAALAVQAAPAASPAAVKAALEATARDRGAPGKDDEWGAGLVDAEAVVQAVSGATNAVTTPFPTASRLTGSVPTGGSTTVPIQVAATGAPLAVTVTITSGNQGCLLYWPGSGCVWPGEWSPDLDAELRGPSGAVVATSACALSGWMCTAAGRQETLLVTEPVAGTYSLRVYAWNGGPGGSFAADVSSGPVVGSSTPPPSPTNSPPTVNAGPDVTVTLPKGAKTTSVTLTGTATDPDGSITSVRWTQGTSATVLSSTTTLTRTVGVGTYDYTLTATDNGGASSSDTARVTVKRR
jgi:serine protease AprX